MTDAFQVKSFDAEVKDIDTKQGVVTGYFASFGNVDSDGDVIQKGAFAKSIAENGPQSEQPRIMHLWQHDAQKPLGRPHVLKEDDHGLYFESKIADTSWGADALKLYEAGVINEHSIGFQTLRSKSDHIDGDEVNVIKEVKLYEGSSVTWGANENTPTTGMKGMDVDKAVEKVQRLTKAVRSGTFRDETFHLLEIQLKQLEQFIIDNVSPKSEQEPSSDKDTPADLTPKDVDEMFDEFTIKHLI